MLQLLHFSSVRSGRNDAGISNHPEALTPPGPVRAAEPQAFEIRGSHEPTPTPFYDAVCYCAPGRSKLAVEPTESAASSARLGNYNDDK